MIKFIAEIGSNHNQGLERTLQLIECAKEIGGTSVKFQLFKADKLYHPSFKSRIKDLKKSELPESFLSGIRRCCDDLDIKLGITVFDLDAVDVAVEYADWLKVGSYELLHATN